jgi:hypothetical protein
MPIAIGVAELVDRALKAQKIPIDGVSIGDPADRTTWTVQYRPDATDEQRKAGDALLATLDPQDAATVAAVKGDVASARLNDDLLMAIVHGIYEAIPSPTLKLNELRARIREIYKGLL